MRELTRKEPVKMNAALAGGIEDVCKELGFTSMRLNSGAGHEDVYKRQELPRLKLRLRRQHLISTERSFRRDLQNCPAELL